MSNLVLPGGAKPQPMMVSVMGLDIKTYVAAHILPGLLADAPDDVEPADIVSLAFDFGEAFEKEAERRG